jgi:hypothetical protein
MKPAIKLASITGGYVAAALVAAVAVSLRMAATSGPVAQASSGMYAFGDAVLFLVVFGVCAVVPTAAGLFLLRPYRRFWTALSVTGIGVALTGLIAAAIFILGRHAVDSPVAAWTALAVLRMLVAPGLAGIFFLCALCAPYRWPRRGLLVATALETAVSACGGLLWVVPL